MREATLNEINNHQEKINELASQNHVTEWKFFDHVIEGKKFPHRARAHMLVSSDGYMDRQNWNEFTFRVNLLFSLFNIKIYTSDSLADLVEEQRLSKELADDIINKAKTIQELMAVQPKSDNSDKEDVKKKDSIFEKLIVKNEDHVEAGMKKSLEVQESTSLMHHQKKEYSASHTSLFSSSYEKQNVIPQEFVEMFKGAFEVLDLSDIHEPERKILLFLLKDKSYTPEQIVLFARELSLPLSLTNSMDVLYCALHPEKWETTSFIEHTRNLLDNTAKFSLPLAASPEELSQRREQLKKIAKVTVENFPFYKEEIMLNAEELSIKENILQRVNSTRTLSSKSTKVPILPISQKVLCKGIIDDYLEPYYSEHSIDSDSLSESIDSPREEEIQEIELKLQDLTIKEPVFDKWKLLNRFNETWKDIYALVKFPKSYNRSRDESYMFEVVKAILYHEEKHCSWKSLPQDFISGGQVYYYNRLWEKEGTLEKIMTLATNMPNPTLETPHGITTQVS